MTSCVYLDDLDSFLPLLGHDGSIQRLDCSPSLDVVVDGSVQLFVVGQVVPPILLQVDNLTRELPPGQLHCPGVSMALAVTVQGLLLLPSNFLIQFTCETSKSQRVYKKVYLNDEQQGVELNSERVGCHLLKLQNLVCLKTRKNSSSSFFTREHSTLSESTLNSI